jgi:DNA excision repair protein ERCC-4
MNLLNFGADDLESDFDIYYGLLRPEETVLIRAYSDDTDDRLLSEIRPKFIVMFEPDMDFVRRIEVRCLPSSTYHEEEFGSSKFTLGI